VPRVDSTIAWRSPPVTDDPLGILPGLYLGMFIPSFPPPEPPRITAVEHRVCPPRDPKCHLEFLNDAGDGLVHIVNPPVPTSRPPSPLPHGCQAGGTWAPPSNACRGARKYLCQLPPSVLHVPDLRLRLPTSPRVDCARPVVDL
jgi:hypothetical protein